MAMKLQMEAMKLKMEAQIAELDQKLNRKEEQEPKKEFHLDWDAIAAIWGVDKVATTPDNIPATPTYTFIARNSRFPDPKHCNFFTPAWAQLFVVPKTKAEGSPAKVPARFALSTAMVMQATNPPYAPQRCDSNATLASTSSRPPKYSKISSTAPFAKYSTAFKFSPSTRQKRTNEYASGRTSSTGLYIKYNPANAQCLTGYSTVIVRKKNQQEPFFQNHTGPHCTEYFLTSTVYTTALLGETDRQEFYRAFRKPPPYRDKLQPSGTEFNSTVHTKSKGASLRREHYQAFRRPLPYRDKHS